MKSQYQAIWEEFARRKRSAIKAKKAASSMIVVGVIFLLLTFAMIAILAAYTNFGDFHNTLGVATDYCSGVTIAVGVLGVLFLLLGYWRQSSANTELWNIEQEKHAVRLQIKSDEENSWPGTPAA
jgi:protein-S-isoprenylcysteine O-methyltransferase Ste14